MKVNYRTDVYTKLDEVIRKESENDTLHLLASITFDASETKEVRAYHKAKGDWSEIEQADSFVYRGHKIILHRPPTKGYLE